MCEGGFSSEYGVSGSILFVGGNIAYSGGLTFWRDWEYLYPREFFCLYLLLLPCVSPEYLGPAYGLNLQAPAG